MFPSLKLVGPPFALFRLWRKNDACPPVIVLVHLKAVFILLAAERANLFLLLSFFSCAGAESNFLRFFPSFLSEKSEVICKLCPFQPTQVHAAVSSEGYAVLGRAHWCTCLGKREKKASWRSFISVTFPFGFMTSDLYNVKSHLDMWDLLIRL